MVVITGASNTFGFPEPIKVPPQAPEYQFQVPAVPGIPPVKYKLAEFPGQTNAGLAEIEDGQQKFHLH